MTAPPAGPDPGREEEWSADMRRALDGDAAAYRRFLSGVAPVLRAMALRRLGRSDAPASEAEDLAQEVLLAVHLKRGTWDPARPIGPWLSAILRNKLIDAQRRRGRHVTVPVEELTEELAAAGGAEITDRLDARRAVARLREPWRDIVRSIALEGRSVRETARRLDMSEGAVRVALHRALRALAMPEGGGSK